MTTYRGITAEAEPGAPDNPTFADCKGWTVTLTRMDAGRRRQMQVHYYTGSGIHHEPRAKDVITSLCDDAARLEQDGPAFENWAEALGFGIKDSAQARRIWHAVTKQTARLRRFLGADFDAFVYPAPGAGAEIVREGMGGFGKPPGHPAHTFSVRTYDDSAYSLAAAVDADDLPPAIRERAAQLLAEYRPPAIESREARLWIRRVLASLRNCYNGVHLTAHEERDGTMIHCHGYDAGHYTGANEHTHPIATLAGVIAVREVYPEYVPSDRDLMEPNCSACGHHLNAHANGDGGKCTVILDMPGYKDATTEDAKGRTLCGCAEFSE